MRQARIACNAAAARRLALLVGALGFFAFMPYAATNVGNRSAIQVGDILTILLVAPVLFMPWSSRPFWMYPVLLAPLCIATLRIALAAEADAELSFKSLIFSAIPLLTLLTAQLYAPRHTLELLTGAALAAIVHAIVGLWQWRAFEDSEFPLLWLYQNQSFLSIQEYADTIARYTRRPFGIFPEPSAMAASLSPLVLLWIAELCGLVRLLREPARWQRVLFAAAAAGSIGLMILSRSGHAAVTVVVACTFCAVWFIRSRANSRTYVAVLVTFGVLVPVILAFAAASLSDRLGGAWLGNSSWEDRTNSLLIGLSVLGDGGAASAIFGIGPGQSAPALWERARLEAVWSVLLTYIYETGLIGLAAIACVGIHLLRIWKASAFSLAFAGIVAVWLVGITITTSYTQLLPLWITLGLLSVWPSFCHPSIECGGRP